MIWQFVFWPGIYLKSYKKAKTAMKSAQLSISHIQNSFTGARELYKISYKYM